MPHSSAIPDEELAAFLAASPPRRNISPQIRRAAMRQTAPWAPIVFGVFFGLFGLIFVGSFTPWRSFDDLRLKGAPVVSGTVTEVSAAHLRINKVQVIRYVFSYQPPSQRQMEGECFTTGERWNVGDKVSVRYLSKQPEVSCIDGARRSESSFVTAFVWIFPLAGFGLAGAGMRSRRNTARLLEQGIVGEGLVTKVELTGTRVKRRRVYKITIERASASPLVMYRYQSAFVSFAQQRLESEKSLFLLSDPLYPKRILLPEAF